MALRLKCLKENYNKQHLSEICIISEIGSGNGGKVHFLLQPMKLYVNYEYRKLNSSGKVKAVNKIRIISIKDKINNTMNNKKDQ